MREFKRLISDILSVFLSELVGDRELEHIIATSLKLQLYINDAIKGDEEPIFESQSKPFNGSEDLMSFSTLDELRRLGELLISIYAPSAELRVSLNVRELPSQLAYLLREIIQDRKWDLQLLMRFLLTELSNEDDLDHLRSKVVEFAHTLKMEREILGEIADSEKRFMEMDLREANFNPIYNTVMFLLELAGGEVELLYLEDGYFYSEDGSLRIPVRDVHGPQLSYLGSLIPMNARGRLIGAALLSRWLPWAVLVTLQMLLNISVEVKLTADRIQRESVSRDSLLRLIRALGSSMNIDTLLQVIVDVGREIFEASLGVLMMDLLDEPLIVVHPEMSPEEAQNYVKLLNSIVLRYAHREEIEPSGESVEVVDFEDYKLVLGSLSFKDHRGVMMFLIPPRSYTLFSYREHKRMMEALLKSLTIALDTHYLINTLVKRTLQLRNIFNFSREVMSHLEVRELIKNTLNWLTASFSLDLVAFLELDSLTKTFKVREVMDVVGLLDEETERLLSEVRLALIDIPHKLMDSLREGEIFVIPRDVGKFKGAQPLLQFFNLFKRDKYVLIPLVMDEELRGLIFLGGMEVLEEDEEILKSLASVTSIALSRGMIWESLRDRYELMRAFNELIVRALEGNDIQEIFRLALERLANLFPKLAMGVYVPSGDEFRLLKGVGLPAEAFNKLMSCKTLGRKLFSFINQDEGRDLYLVENLLVFVSDPELFTTLRSLKARNATSIPFVTRSKELIGFLVAIGKDGGFNERELEGLRLFSHHLKLIVENLVVYQSLIGKLRDLTEAYKLIRALCQEREEDEFLRKVLSFLRDYLSANRGLIYSFKRRRWREIDASADKSFKLRRGLQRELEEILTEEGVTLRQGSYIIFNVSDLVRRGYRELADYLMEGDATRLILIPLAANSELLEVIYLPLGKGERLSGDQEELLSILMPIISLLWNALQMLKFESVTAEILRRNLLLDPLQVESLKGLYPIDIGLKYVSAKEFTADYLDVVPVSHDKLLVILSDVSGKGPEAAIHTVQAKYTIRALSFVTDDLGFITTKLNQLIYDSMSEERYMTAFIALLDFSNQELKYVICGHEPPIVLVGDKVEFLESEEYLPLGAFKEVDYQERRLKIKPGMILLVYSDGVTEARNSAGEFFGQERLKRALWNYRNETANMIVTKIYRDVKLFIRERETHLRDDLSLIVIKIQ